jgi:hypothetical protein
MINSTNLNSFLKDNNIPVVNFTRSVESNLEMIKTAIGVLQGPKTMSRQRPYNGQPWTDTGSRGETLVKGLTFRDIKDCYTLALIQSYPYYKEGTLERIEPNATLIDEADKGEKAQINGNDLYTLVGDIDPLAVSQNLSCWIERYMGIYPNVPKLTIPEL